MFLVGHNDQTGVPLAAAGVLGLGLSAALLAELLIGRWVEYGPGSHLEVRFVPAGFEAAVQDPAVLPASDVTGWVLAHMLREPRTLPVRAWLEFLAPRAAQRLAERLRAGGWVTGYERRGLLLRRAQPVFAAPVRVALVAVGIHEGLRRSALNTIEDVMLALLLDVAGLSETVLWLDELGRGYLDSRLVLLPPPLHALLGDTRMAVATTVLTRT